MNSEIPTMPSLTGDGDLGRGAVLHHIQQRHNCGDREVNVSHGGARFEQYLPEAQLDALEVRQPALPD
jgi:hypothetical protein